MEEEALQTFQEYRILRQKSMAVAAAALKIISMGNTGL